MPPPQTRAAAAAPDAASRALEACVRHDQLQVLRRNLAIALPVNTILSILCALVAWRAGEHKAALLWLAATLVVNATRGLIDRTMPADSPPGTAPGLSAGEVDRQLGTLWAMALLSGCVWALLPGLCALYTAPQSLVFLVVQCGITAGAIAQGGAYARIPIAFNTPVLLSALAAMVYIGGFHRYALAVAMLVYLVALVATGRRAETAFANASRLTHRVTAMNASLEAARAQAVTLADAMRYRADHDLLTDLFNRAGFLREAERYLSDRSHAICLMLLDLDGFKAINDAFGHRIGDEILVEVANRLRRTLAPGMLVGRWGGDEFAVLYSADRTAPAATRLANQLIAAVAAPFSAFGSAARIGVSIGIHVAGNATMCEMLACADFALYAAKASGRNRCYLFNEDLRQQLEVRRDVERDLPTALAEHHVEVWFQPIFGDAGARVCSLEALVRWRHPSHGWIAPPDLMATAAKAGLARPLMDFILDRVCAMIAALRDLQRSDVSVAMNVSPREMSQLPVDEIVLGALLSRDLSPFALEIEITEETALDIAHAGNKLAMLAQAGIQITIDDFGVGYSSLASLRKLNVDRIKIDRCFVTGLGDSEGDQMIVKAILNLADSLRLDVVAEGVESADDVQILRAMGCPFLQGYHLARPMPLERCLAFVESAAGSAAVSTERALR